MVPRSPPPQAPAPSPGSPPSETCTCCSFRPEGPSSHSPSVKPTVRPDSERRAPPVSPAPPRLPAGPELPHHNTINCDCPAGSLCPLPPPPPGLTASPPHTLSRAGGRESPTALLEPEPGSGRPRAGRGCSRGGDRGRNGGDVPGRGGCIRAREVGQEESQGRRAAAGRLRNWGRVSVRRAEGTPRRLLTCAGGRRLLALGAHPGAPPAPPPAAPAPAEGPGMRGRGEAAGARARAFGPGGGPGAPSRGVRGTEAGVRSSPAAGGRGEVSAVARPAEALGWEVAQAGPARRRAGKQRPVREDFCLLSPNRPQG